MKIEKKDLHNQLMFLFRLQDSIAVKNLGTLPDQDIVDILSSVSFNGIMVIYQMRYPDGVEVMSPSLAEGIDRWASIAEPYFNNLNKEINQIMSDYGGLGIGKVQLAIVVAMDELADKLIEDDQIQVSRRQINMHAHKGNDMLRSKNTKGSKEKKSDLPGE